MNPSLSLYLDLLRFLAAFAVLVGHVSSMPFTDQLKWWHLNSYGDAAVIIFFVLSGYVIAYVTHTREKTAREYFSARIARLYSVVGICLALTFALDLVGMHFRPDFYAIQKVLWKPPSLSGYLSSAFFVNEYQAFNFDGISPGSNAPYWSLSFEATYYAIAGIVLFSPLKYSIPATFLILCMAGKTISALFPLWLLGYFLYRAPTRPRSPFISNRFLTTTFIAAGLLVLAAPGLKSLLPNDNFGHFFPWGRAPFNRNLLADYTTGIAFAIHLYAARALLAQRDAPPPSVVTIARLLGTATFPLYCVHYPAICFLAALSPFEKNTYSNLILIACGTLLLVAALTPFCEYLKRRIRATI